MCDVKSVLEYGAVGNGIQDDYFAIQAALDSGASEIIIPHGVYCVSKTLLVRSNTSIVADKTAKIVLKSVEKKKRGDFLISNADTLTGNENIKITGGIWDGNNILPEHKKADIFDQNGYSGALMNFINVNGLVLKDMVLANSSAYYTRFCKLHNFVIEDISFVSDTICSNQDGLHFCGDVKNGRVKNIRALNFGQTSDDLIALNADDYVDRVENLDLCRGNIEDIDFENIYAESCHSLVRMLSVTSEIKNIRFKNVFGGFRSHAINADAARHCRTPVFNEEDYPEGVGRISNIHVENLVCYPMFVKVKGAVPARIKEKTALSIESHMDGFILNGFRFSFDEDHPGKALKCMNLVNAKICVDGVDYSLNDKSEVLSIDNLSSLSVDLG